MLVVDYYSPHGRSFMDCLALNGVSGIARYLTNSMADQREVTVQEVTDAHAAGLAVHFFFEMNPTYAGYFTDSRGRADCFQACARLKELGAPNAVVVYFAVDAPTSKIPVAVLDDYFDGVVNHLRDTYGSDQSAWPLTVGIYGFEAHIQYARTRFENVKHYAQTYGTPRGQLDLWQHEQQAMCGVSVDINDATVEGWRPSGGPKPSSMSLEEDVTPEEAKAIAQQVLADAGLDANTIETIKGNLTETSDTIKTMKRTYDPLYHHRHLPVGPVGPDSEPLVPPVEGAKYAGSSEDLTQIFWLYPDGTRHNWVNGQEA